jgi:hypothetical protein
VFQIKRIHEYKRQLMNVLSIIQRYKELKAMKPEERKKVVPRVCMFGGKAASGGNGSAFQEISSVPFLSVADTLYGTALLSAPCTVCDSPSPISLSTLPLLTHMLLCCSVPLSPQSPSLLTLLGAAPVSAYDLA